MTPDTIGVLLLAAAGMTVAVALAWAASSDRTIRSRHARRPPVDGARPPCGPGAAHPAPLAFVDLPRTEPQITPSALVRPFVTHLGTPLAAPSTVPTPLVARANGHPVLQLHRCGICRDGAGLPAGIRECPWCGAS